MALTERNNISIAEIVIYLPAIAVGIFLAIKHGFGRNAGWLYMILFATIRVVGACTQLATISQPQNTSLYIAYVTLQNIGLSPLILVQLALLSRALVSIRKTTSGFVTATHLRLVQLLVSVGLILGAVGGSQVSSSSFEGSYDAPTISKAGMGLNIAGYVLLVLVTAAIAMQISHADAGEKRLVLAVILSLPFILVRLAYSAEGTLGDNPDFNMYAGNVNVQLGMAVIMEMIVVAIVEAFGLTLRGLDASEKAAIAAQSSRRRGGRRQQQHGAYHTETHHQEPPQYAYSSRV